MGLITEAKLRRYFLINGVSEFYSVLSNDILTPAAIDFLKERKVEIVYSDECGENVLSNSDKLEYSVPLNKDKWQTSDKYKNFYTGESLSYKPEAMTHLFENVLVYKDDPRIVLRGCLDTLQAHIIETQVYLEDKGRIDLLSSLDNLLHFTREILKHEVLNTSMTEQKVLDMSAEDIREMSHNPEKYFKLKQMVLVNYKLGAIVSKLNFLRTYSRECELSAVKAFRDNDKINQNTIIQALNRLSSCFHILMYKELSNNAGAK